MCRNCGALVGAGESQCAVCGTAAGAPPPAAAHAEYAAHDPEGMRFARAVLTRPVIFTFVFLAVNVFIFLLMSRTGGGTEDPRVLLLYGAKFNSLIDEGQWWRLVTPVFLHIGWMHLFVNMYSLFVLGPYVERLYGSARFVFFWIATGIAGVAASYLASSTDMHQGFLGRFLFRGGDGPSAGASGALFGLVGVLFVFGIKFRHELPENFKRAFGFGMLPTILINLFIGYTIPFIDNAAHLGGFVAGAVLALFVGYKRPGQRASVAVFWHALQFAALALVVVGFGQVARHFQDTLPSLGAGRRNQPPAISFDAAQIMYFVNAMNEGERAFASALGGGDSETAAGALMSLEMSPRLDEQSGELRDELKQLIARARDLAPLLRDKKKRLSPREAEQLRQLLAEKAAWDRRYAMWVSTEGGKYGLMIRHAAPPSGGGTQAQPPAPRDGR